MARKRLFWHLYPLYLLIAVGVALSVTWYAGSAVRRLYLDATQSALEARAVLARRLFLPLVESGADDEVDALCVELGGEAGARFTVILPDGRVVGESDEAPALMDDHNSRAEVREALAGRAGRSVRPSPTRKREMVYVAVPIEKAGEVLGVVRAAVPMASVKETLGPVYAGTLLAAAVIAAAAAAVSLLASRRVARPLEDLQRGADAFAHGQLGHRVAVQGSSEIGALARSMNQMAAALDDRMRAVVQQRNEMEAVLGSMSEGVVSLDRNQRILSVNPSAAGMLDIDAERADGASIQEVIRNPDLQAFVAKALVDDEPAEGEVTLPTEGESRHVRVRSAALRDADDQTVGTLLVLYDVTRLRRLEMMRREFVANVSHELRTPITAIKGFAETLLETPDRTPGQEERYLQIIARQADRLQALFEDLLTLSRTEQQLERGNIGLQAESVKEVVESAVASCHLKAEQKNVTVQVECAEDARAELNAALLEQAVFNLIDNAIAYSAENSRVEVKAVRAGDEVAISVRDTGRGIAPEHLQRVFERFYRADKGRDRKTGGTGLGLSIVKHIVVAHRGRVTVESRLGQGSTFTIHLPACR